MLKYGQMSDTKKLKYSIIIPCFNEELYIEATLQSLKKQDYKGKFEVIVIDNNCTDKTAELAKKYEVRIIKEKRPGVCFARQAGVDAARAEIIISTDADTTFSKDWISKIDKEFNKNTNLIAVCGSCRYTKGPWWGKLYPHFLFGFVTIYNKLFGNIVYITATNIAFKKEFFEGYNTELTQGGDEIALLDQLKQKGPIKFKKSLKVNTSPRRLNKGLFYNVFISFFYYYILAYQLNKRFNRRIIGSAPAYRSTKLKALKISPIAILFLIVVASAVLLSSYFRHNFELSRDAYVLVKNAFTHIYNSLT